MGGKAVEFHEAAALEYEAAFDWYLQRSEPAASMFALELERAIALIAGSPRRWPRDVRNTRRFLLRRFPFSLVYREHDSVIQILAIAHGRRRPEYWKQRL